MCWTFNLGNFEKHAVTWFRSVSFSPYSLPPRTRHCFKSFILKLCQCVLSFDMISDLLSQVSNWIPRTSSLRGKKHYDRLESFREGEG